MARVLLVDDNPDDVDPVVRLLREHGHDCRTLADGTRAVAEAKAFEPHIILLDIVMEGQDGFATCRQLKRDPGTKAIPVIFMSGRTAESDQFWGRKIGAADYLCKPFTSEQLYSAVDAALKLREGKQGEGAAS